MAFAPAAIMMAGSVLSAGAAVHSGIQQKKAADYNASVIEQQRKQEQMEAKESIIRKRQEARAIMGRRSASAAAKGRSTETGAGLLADAQTAANLTMQILELSRTAESRSRSLISSQRMTKKQGQTALTSGLLQAGGSLLQGAGSMY